MKYLVWAVFFLPLGLICALSLVGGFDDAVSPLTAVGFAEDSKDLPPLVVDKEKPLKLKDPKPAPIDPWGVPAGPVANNRSCFVCHGNLKEDALTTTHAKANVSCIKCHGKSAKHQADEENIIPPETMFAADKINKACGKCHDSHDAPAEKVIALWETRSEKRLDPEKIVCTDCHGTHRMKVRTVVWDKATGKLIAKKEKKECEKDKKEESKEAADEKTEEVSTSDAK